MRDAKADAVATEKRLDEARGAPAQGDRDRPAAPRRGRRDQGAADRPRVGYTRTRDGKAGALRDDARAPPASSRATSAALEQEQAAQLGQLQAARTRGRPADPPRLRQHDLAGQRADRLAVRRALGPAARGHRHRRPARARRSAPRTPAGRAAAAGPAATATTPASQHGGSLSTCYAHQSRFATRMGASVSKGQVIGYVGCTGHWFGDHLHFEVRVNGVAGRPAWATCSARRTALAHAA